MEHSLANTEVTLQPADRRRLAGNVWPVYAGAFFVGVAALAAALLISLLLPGGWSRFGFAYLTGFAYVLSLSLGGLFFVLVTHLFRAGWSVVVRRPAEALAMNMPTVAALFVPIAVLVLVDAVQPPVAEPGEAVRPTLYVWALPDATLEHNAELDHHAGHAEPSAEHVETDTEHPTSHTRRGQGDEAMILPMAGEHADTPHAPSESMGDDQADADPYDGAYDDVAEDQVAGVAPTAPGSHLVYEMVENKRPYLNAGFFLGRWVAYFSIWIGFGLFFWKLSNRQDRTGDPRLTRRMEMLAAPGTLIFALSLTFAAFDLIMSLDPVFYSTIFGVYYFAGCAVSVVALLILGTMGLQRAGYIPAVSTEHLHDLGKLLFAFVFFWGYIAYSQYMLIWYANLPETTYWMAARGLTTDPRMIEFGNIFAWMGLVLLFAHLLIPFAALLSRHVKRNRFWLGFWAAWMLVIHWVDLYWLIWPVLGMTGVDHSILDLVLGVLCLVGVGSIFAGGLLRLLAHRSLVPVGDPRLSESLAFANH